MSEWKSIETAPTDGRPVWTKGYNWGDESKGTHCQWAYWDGANWMSPGADGSTLLYLVQWRKEWGNDDA